MYHWGLIIITFAKDKRPRDGCPCRRVSHFGPLGGKNFFPSAQENISLTAVVQVRFVNEGVCRWTWKNKNKNRSVQWRWQDFETFVAVKTLYTKLQCRVGQMGIVRTHPPSRAKQIEQACMKLWVADRGFGTRVCVAKGQRENMNDVLYFYTSWNCENTKSTKSTNNIWQPYSNARQNEL